MAGKKREAGDIQQCITYVNTGLMSWSQFCCLPWAFQMPGSFSISEEAGSKCLEQTPGDAAPWAVHRPRCGAFSSSLMSLKPCGLKICLAPRVSAIQPTSKSPHSWWLGITHLCLPCLRLPPATSSPCSLDQISSPSLLAACTKWCSQHLFPFLCGLDGWKAQ